MKTFATLLLTLVVFAAAAGASWWVKSHQTPLPENTSTQSPQDPAVEMNDISDIPSERIQERLEIASNPEPVSIEEMVRLGMNLKQREKDLNTREEKLKQAEIHQQIAFSEIQTETRKIDELRSQVQSELDRSDLLIDRLIQARQAVIEEKENVETKLKEAKSTLTEVEGQHMANTRKLSQWIQSMDEEKAAEVLRELANDGKMSVAVQILSHLEEREAAQILSELDDAKLVQDLVTEFRNLKSPTEANRGRRTQR